MCCIYQFTVCILSGILYCIKIYNGTNLHEKISNVIPVLITNTISKDYVREFLKHSSGASVHQSQSILIIWFLKGVNL
jgi:hypothetical protein